MAKIYISYQRDDAAFVIDLANRLKLAGHILTYDVEELTPGTEWRTALDIGLVFDKERGECAARNPHLHA